MMGYTVAINSVFAIMIAATYLFGNVKNGTADSTFLLNLLFYIIITPIITVTLTKMMYAGENTMVVEDALSRIDSILEMQPLKETEKKEIPADTSITFENVSFRYKGASKDEILSHEVQDGTTMMDNQGYDIAFKNVGFSYNIGDAVLKDVTFTAKQDEVTALIGPSFWM
ncbi:hypothetical protein [Dorea longicatena]|jgi:ATP-binding cassette subfamily B protein IrtA|uniref:hypothetical protein n=1 Tax=Dorea longicatena TaxID=88431 RepID=UPI002ED264B9